MNQENKWAIVFAGLSAVLLGVIIVLLLRRDRVPPEIRFEENKIKYTAGMEETLLLEGMSAWDDQDGDVTEQIVIEKVNVSSDGQLVTVVYAVCDGSKNFTKASRVFEMDDTGIKEAEKKPDKESGTPAESETLPEEKGGPENSGTEKDSAKEKADEAKTAEEKPEEARAEEKPQEEEAPEEEKQADVPPEIQLNTNEAILKKGDMFDWANYIGSVTDDRDSTEMLYGNLHMTGELDMQTPGDYTVSLRVMDSAGNASEEQKLTVHVTE